MQPAAGWMGHWAAAGAACTGLRALPMVQRLAQHIVFGRGVVSAAGGAGPVQDCMTEELPPYEPLTQLPYEVVRETGARLLHEPLFNKVGRTVAHVLALD